MFPVEYPTIYDMYKKHTAAFWTAEDVDLAQDMKDWEALGEDEKRFVKEGLAWVLSHSRGQVGAFLESRQRRGCPRGGRQDSSWLLLTPGSRISPVVSR